MIKQLSKIKIMFVLHPKGFEKMKKVFPKYFENGISDFNYNVMSNPPSFEEMKKFDIVVVGGSGNVPSNREIFGNDLSRILEETKTGIVSLMWQNDASGRSNCDIRGRWQNGVYNPVYTGDFVSGTVFKPFKGLIYTDEKDRVRMRNPKVCSVGDAYAFKTQKMNKKRRSRIIAFWDCGETSEKIFSIAELCDLKHIQMNFCPVQFEQADSQYPNYGRFVGAEELILGCCWYLHLRENKDIFQQEKDLRERIDYLVSDESGVFDEDRKIEININGSQVLSCNRILKFFW